MGTHAEAVRVEWLRHVVFPNLPSSETSMRKISKQAAREKAVGNVLASLKIESLVPSPEVVSGLHACIERKDSTDNVLAKVLRRHVTLRRG